MLNSIAVPVLSVLMALALGAVAIWITGGDPLVAYRGLIDGAFLKPRAFSETLIATTPYLILALSVGFGFRCGLFNIGVEGQYYIGQIAAVYVAYSVSSLPGLIHLPLVILAGMAGGAAWASIPAFLKVRFGAHEVITTMMMNYIAILLADYLVGLKGPMRDPKATVPQSPPIQPTARLPRFNELPGLMESPLLHVVAALVCGLVLLFFIWLLVRYGFNGRFKKTSKWVLFAVAGVVTVLSFVVLGNLTALGGPFVDKGNRLHVGVLMAFTLAFFMWWLLFKTTLGFEVRAVGANRDAAEYAGINAGKNIMIAMLISGALAGLAGTIEVIGLDRVLKSFFSAGYGFDAIAISLLGNNHPLGAIPSALLFGALRNGADLMELRSGVSKHMISIIQALILLFVSAPAIIRWIFRLKAPAGQSRTIVTSGWGK
jgi:simple sugar transport system permease protein